MDLAWALTVAVIYFGSFLAIGFVARIGLRRLMDEKGADLANVQAQAEPNRGKRNVFLLGAWRKDG